MHSSWYIKYSSTSNSFFTAIGGKLHFVYILCFFPWKTLTNLIFCFITYCSKRLSDSKYFYYFFLCLSWHWCFSEVFFVFFLRMSYYWLRMGRCKNISRRKIYCQQKQNYNLNVSSTNNIVEQFSRFLQSFLGSFLSNISIKFSNE